MAGENVNNTIKTTVELDVNQAQQEIVKLNSLASDSTQDLEKRLAAKNKQIEIQNDLNKKNIKDLEKILNNLKKEGASQKDIEKAQNKLNKAKLNEVKVNERNAKQQKKLAAAYGNSKGALNKLNNATGGFIDKLKLLAANPIVLVITALVGALTALQKAFVSSEEGQDKWAKAMTILSTVVGNFMDLLSDFANLVVDAILEPQKAWDSLVESFDKGYQFIKKQVIDRFSGAWKILSGGVQSGILKMRIAWNDFTGDADEAEQLRDELEKVNEKIKEGIELTNGANEAIVSLYNDAKEAVTEFIKEQEREIEIAKRIADQRALADKVERELIVARAKANRDRAAALEESVNKEKNTIQERIEFLKEAGRIEQEITDKEIVAAKLRLEAKVAENALANSTKEDLKEEAELRARIIDLETARLVKQKEVTGQIQAFRAEAKAEQDRIDAEAKKKEEEEAAKAEEARQLEKENLQRDREAQIEFDQLELERKRELGEATLEDELEFLEKKRIQDVSQEDLRQSEIDAINKQYQLQAERLRELDKNQAKQKDEAVLNSALGSVGQLFGASKEVSIASALINTWKGISEVWAAKSETGLVGAGLAQKIATSAIVAAQGFKTVKEIVKTKAPSIPGGGGGGASGGGGAAAAAAPAIPTASTTSVSDLTSRNEARNSGDSALASNSSATASANVQGSSSGTVIFSEGRYRDFVNQINFRENKSKI